MLARISGRLLTSPLAFFVAGAIDIGWMLGIYARWRLAQRREQRLAQRREQRLTAGAGGLAGASPPS